MSVGDLEDSVVEELSKYLDNFGPVDDEGDARQYWDLLALELRSNPKTPQEFKYTTHELANIDKAKNSSSVFIKKLAAGGLSLDLLVACLKRINCSKAINVFTRASKPEITEVSWSGNEVTVRTGNAISLSVSAHCLPGPIVYQWFKNQKEPLTGQTAASLTLREANAVDNGWYFCRLTNPFINDPHEATEFTKYVQVIVSPPSMPNTNPTIRQEVGSVSPSQAPVIVAGPTVSRDPTGRVVVTVRAQRALCYEWYKDNQLFKSAQTTGELELGQLSSSIAGEYRCQVINDHGRVTSEPVPVRLDPMIVIEEQPPSTLSVNSGEDIRLSCRARSLTGEPLSYKWIQLSKGEEIERSRDEELVAKTAGIRRRVKLKFFCRIAEGNNPSSSITSQTCTVTVLTVWFTKQPCSVEKAYIGDKATLSCAADGMGSIEYIWFKASTKTGDYRPLRTSGGKSGVLHFNRLRNENWGYYMCQASNDSHVATSDTVSLKPTIPTMRRNKSFKKPLIRIAKQPWSQVIPEGKPFTLLCEGVCTADLVLDYQWHCRAKPIPGATDSKYFRQSMGESDCGIYYCEVKARDSSTSVAPEPVLSRNARIELASDGGELVVGQNFSQIQQNEGERVLCTKSQERYAREKVALLIGNQNYQCPELNNLTSPQHDIRELGKLLEDLGFKVISLLDLNHSEMMGALEIFYELLAVSGVYALFYYSGHGFITQSGKNYLNPTNSTLPLTTENSINAELICRQMRKRLSRAVVVLDCCRVLASTIEESVTEPDSLPQTTADHQDVNLANYMLITSCQDGNPAYDGDSTDMSPATPSAPKQFPRETCSNFNIAFREALEKRKKLADIFHYILDRTIQLERGTGRQGQRPVCNTSFRDNQIALHDDFFMDSNENQPKLEKIHQLHENLHYVPETVVMEDGEMGKLTGLASLELSFTFDFSNVLFVHSTLHLLQPDKTARPVIIYDTSFLERQGVGPVASEVVHSPFQEEESPHLTTRTRIASTQRLDKDKLKLFLNLSLQLLDGGETIETQVTYKFPKKPLFDNL